MISFKKIDQKKTCILHIRPAVAEAMAGSFRFNYQTFIYILYQTFEKVGLPAEALARRKAVLR
jgi:hypothetical protein